MRPPRRSLDDSTAERLLTGAVGPADAPPGFSNVADVLNRAGQSFESAANDSLIAAMATAAASPTPNVETRRHPMLVKLLTAKAFAAVAAVTLTATGAAAATGSLPDAAQDGMADAASHVGLNLPDSASDKAREASAKDKAAKDKADEDDDASAADASDDSDRRADNHGATVSDTARNSDAEGREHGQEVSDAARDNHGHDATDERHDGRHDGRGEAADDDATDDADDPTTDDADDPADHDSDDDDSPDTDDESTDDEDASDHGGGRGRG